MFNKRVRCRQIHGSYNQRRYDSLLFVTAIVSMSSFEQLIFSCNKLKYLCMKQRLKSQMLTAALRVRSLPRGVFSFCRFISLSFPLYLYFSFSFPLPHFLCSVFIFKLHQRSFSLYSTEREFIKDVN